MNLQLQRWAAKAKRRHDINLTWHASVLDIIAKDYDVRGFWLRKCCTWWCTCRGLLSALHSRPHPDDLFNRVHHGNIWVAPTSAVCVVPAATDPGCGVALGLQVHYGARSLQHAVDQSVVNRLAYGHEQGTVVPGSDVYINTNFAGEIVVEGGAATAGSWSLFP